MAIPVITPPTGRLGSIKGASNRDLSQVYQKLVDIEGRLTTANTTQASILTKLTSLETMLLRLIGTTTPTGYTGLPDELRAARTAVETTIPAAIANDTAWLRYWQEVIGNRVYTTMTTAQDISAVLGLIGHLPTGSTIKDLLRSIDGNVLDIENCVCNDGGESYTPAPPSAGCGGEDPNWLQCGLNYAGAVTGGEVDLDIYRVAFPTITPSSIGAVPGVRTVTGGTQTGLTADASEFAGEAHQVCLAWDFQPSSGFYDFDHALYAETNPDLFSSYVSTSGAAPDAGTVGSSRVLLTGAGVHNYYHANFAFVQGSTISGRVWVQVVPPLPA